VQVTPLLSLPAKPLTDVSEKFRLLCAEFYTEVHHMRRVVERDLQLKGKVNALDRE
jgi:hypothetical protein